MVSFSQSDLSLVMAKGLSRAEPISNKELEKRHRTAQIRQKTKAERTVGDIRDGIDEFRNVRAENKVLEWISVPNKLALNREKLTSSQKL